MSQIIGWEYYVSHFPVVIPESQFEAVEQQAEIEYRKVVGEYTVSYTHLSHIRII